MAEETYRSYFDIDENYYPQVTESAIEKSEDLWKRTYPHGKFLELLKTTERVMARQEKRSVWISGAYGTGKSQCAYTLKKMFDVPEEELRAYWQEYKNLQQEGDLLRKLLGLKREGEGVVTVYRYAGTPQSTRDLLVAVQESVQAALHARGFYEGENTLKDSVIRWLEEDEANRIFVDSKLQQPEWAALFGSMTTADILARLHEGGEVRDLMERIAKFGNDEGFAYMRLEIDGVLAWLTDVLVKNEIKIVFIWDEFSDFFRVNRESLADFQKLAELVNARPFFFIPVTHETDHLFAEADETWKKIRDRFVDVAITLPDNIAFELIGASFKPKPAAKADWALCEGDLNSRLHDSRQQVMKEAGIASEDVIKSIMPLHPMTALVLKHIASSFQSNQRSMFDFILSVGDEKVKAFQYFIDHTGPLSDHPLLTVDQLWDFFYVRGKADLAPHVRMILDTYEQQTDLREEEQAVLKAVLILLAVEKQLGGNIELLQATDRNLSYVFEGDDSFVNSVRAAAHSLKERGVLIVTPRQKGEPTYDLAMLSGDQGKVEQEKENLRKTTKTDKLVQDGGLGKLLTLQPEGLKPRFLDALGVVQTATIDSFARTIRDMTPKKPWQFQALIAFAKDEKEAAAFRTKIKEAARDDRYRHVIFLDALATPLGDDAFQRYVDFAAMAAYYQGNNRTAAEQQMRQAKQILEQEWKNRIYNGRLIVYTAEQPEGIQLARASEAPDVLKMIVLRRQPHAFDLEKMATEGYYKTNALKQSALAAFTGDVKGTIKDAEKRVLPEVWDVEEYWRRDDMRGLSVSVMKADLEERIAKSFSAGGQIGTAELCDCLLEDYGIPPCNLAAFLLGFLLRSYAGEPYRYGDAAGSSGEMTAEKLAEMLGDYLGYVAKGGRAPRETFIVQMTAEERSFYALTREAWGIASTACGSVAQAATAIKSRMQEWRLPLWCLQDVAEEKDFLAVQQYSDLGRKEGKEAHAIALGLGRMAQEDPALAGRLKALLRIERLQEGMEKFLATFLQGEILQLSEELSNRGQLMQDVRRKFERDYACIWSQETGEERLLEIRTEYRATLATNEVLRETAMGWDRARDAWRERLNFLRVSADSLAEQSAAFAQMKDFFRTLAKGSEFLPDRLQESVRLLEDCKEELTELLGEEETVFSKAYAPYLEGLSESDRKKIRGKVEKGLFLKPKSYANEKVRQGAEEYRRGQLKEQLKDIWKEKTGTLDPRDWSERYRMPVLACVDLDEYDEAKRVFSLLEHRDGKDADFRRAIAFLQEAAFFAALSDEERRDEAFRRNVVGEYASLLPDLLTVREKLSALRIAPYEWKENPFVKRKLKDMARASYEAGGSSKVLSKIDSMDDATLKAYLKRLVVDNMTVGMEILGDE